MHFIPISISWLNLIERWFRELTDKMIRRGVFKSVGTLIEAITGFIEHHNEHPKSFGWTAKAQNILAKVGRARAVLDNGATDSITRLEGRRLKMGWGLMSQSIPSQP